MKTLCAAILAASAWLNSANLLAVDLASCQPQPLLRHPANGDSGDAIVTPDGRFVLFASGADSLARPRTNSAERIKAGTPNVYVRDRLLQVTRLVSVNQAGDGAGDAESLPREISSDGRYALFESRASNLVPGDHNAAWDVFLRDLAAGKTYLVSSAADGMAGNGPSSDSCMTPDGRYVCFASHASNLVPTDSNAVQDVFVRDMSSGSILLASAPDPATPGWANGASWAPTITPDGQMLAFAHSSGRPGVGTTVLGNGPATLFVKDFRTGQLLPASLEAAAITGTTNMVINHALSDDGRFLVYQAAGAASAASVVIRYDVVERTSLTIWTNAAGGALCPGQFDATPDGGKVAFVANAGTGTNLTTAVLLWNSEDKNARLVSGDINGLTPDGSMAMAPSLARNGRYLAFISNGAGLTTNRVSEGLHLYLRDLERGETWLVDKDSSGTGCGVSPGSTIGLSDNAETIVFQAFDSDLVGNDSNGFLDLFAAGLSGGSPELISVNDPGVVSLSLSGQNRLSPGALTSHGELVVYTSAAAQPTWGDTNRWSDVLLWDARQRTNSLLSLSTNRVAGNSGASEPSIAPDGRFVVFTSLASDLPQVTTNGRNVFLYDRTNGNLAIVTRNTLKSESAAGYCSSPRVTDNGRYIAYLSTARNLVPNAAYTDSYYGRSYLFFRDMQAAENVVLELSPAVAFAMTPDARYVAALVLPQSFGSYEVRVYDPVRRLMAWRIRPGSSVAASSISISPNGRFVVWPVSAKAVFSLDTVSGITNRVADLPLATGAGLRFTADSSQMVYSAVMPAGKQVFLYHFATRSNLLVTANASGQPFSGDSDSPDISADGRFIAYRSTAADAVPGVTNGISDIFVYDTRTATTTLVSASLFPGRIANGRSATPVFSGDGKVLAFESWASDLTEGDANFYSDIYLCRVISDSPIPAFQVAISTGNGTTWITWSVPVGTPCQVQYKDSLQEGEWQDLHARITTLGTQAWTQDTNSAAARFYRVVALPPP